MSTPILEFDNRIKSAAINLRSTLPRHAVGTVRVSGFAATAVADGYAAPVVRSMAPTGAWL